MAPIVHGLERQYRDRIDFIYLDIADARNANAKTRFQFVATPQFVLLRADGTVLGGWQGVVTRDSVERALQRLLTSEPARR